MKVIGGDLKAGQEIQIQMYNGTGKYDADTIYDEMNYYRRHNLPLPLEDTQFNISLTSVVKIKEPIHRGIFNLINQYTVEIRGILVNAEVY